MLRRDIVVIGASAGGVETLSRFVKFLPADLPAAMFVVVHIPSTGPSVLPKILSRAGSLPAYHPEDKAPIQDRQIYIAPPNHHLLIQPNQVRLSLSPRQNGYRPAIDALFRSAARAYGQQVVGIILSGTLDDGTVGLTLVKAYGGVALVQDPDEALFKGMPRSAIEHTAVDSILGIEALASHLIQLVHEPIEERKAMPPDESTPQLDLEAEIVAEDKAILERGERPGQPSTLTCPDCGGVLWELQNSDLLRFRCHVGHSYSLDSLATKQIDAVETALWSGVCALEEKAALARRMAVQAKQQNRSISAVQFEERAQEAEANADMVRQVLLQHQQKAKTETKNVLQDERGLEQ